MDELPHVLWTYRTTPRRSTVETPFSMTYSIEAVIPLEVIFSTIRTSQFNINENARLLSTGLDLVEERKEVATVQMAHYQQKLKQGYNRGIKTRVFVPRDLVLRKVIGNTKNPAWEKIRPNWEGPYRITSMVGIRAYRLEDLDENAVP